MRFAPTDDQAALRDAVRELLARECPPAAVRAAWDNDQLPAWSVLAEMGVLDARVPQADGGLGLGVLDLIGVLEEAGRAALPGPLVEHALVAVPSAPRGTRWTASEHFDRAPYATQADGFMLIRDRQLWAVERDAVTVAASASVDGARHLGRLTWSTADATPLGDSAPAYDRAALGTAAVLIGLGSALLDTTVEYAKARHQFGAAIGSFQAVAHPLADVALALEFATPLVVRAAWSIDHGDAEAPVHVSMAKAAASDAATRAARAALQVHGAIGYSFESDLQLWMKRVWALTPAWGDAREHRERVATLLLDRPGARVG